MIQVIMAKQKLVTFKSGTAKSNPPTIIIWSKNFNDFFCANDFGHAIMLIVLLHIKTLSVRLGGTPFNTPNSMTTKLVHIIARLCMKLRIPYLTFLVD
jgi:hypothetical protein